MFRGWQLFSDYRTLTELGSGILEIDFLRESCLHNGRPLPTLSIAKAIAGWWRDDLAASHISIDNVSQAQLTVELQLAEQQGQRDHSRVWADPSPIFISCALKASSVLRTDEATYTSKYQDRLEWPRNWAA
jgi:hypothetical protein